MELDPALAQGLDELDPVHVGHAKIQQDQVVRCGRVVDELKRVTAVEGRDHHVLPLGEHQAVHFLYERRILDDQYFHGAIVPPVEMADNSL